ncbi:hypothetical protein E2C01_035309 [Portunus trituberculatus]|uniref:Uncharacterized protein n=1 Tax=Portunus trituberculatus TaxID=210409 RepID=A0A5B7F9E9_PORTR|nr:hypothetical protein [Portunus trituberculatus]
MTRRAATKESVFRPRGEGEGMKEVGLWRGRIQSGVEEVGKGDTGTLLLWRRVDASKAAFGFELGSFGRELEVDGCVLVGE